MDRTVLRETRTPTWCVGIDDRTTRLWFPDELKHPPPALVDVRVPVDRVLALAAEFGFPHVAATLSRRRAIGFWAPRRLDRVVVHEPTLLPDTAEADSLASLCLWLMAGASERPAEDDYGAARDHLVRTVEDALSRGASLDDGYRMVTDLAAGEVDGPAATKHDGLRRYAASRVRRCS